ncbi:uncharacterized protein [Venturia canescens]|uniref:uncharacterized protein isoform X2 n=1 Tax=Venturia canescens TaxID=32260 RepID=UPI001C9D2C3A|nr:uncharacterized protein LOC122405958 isoform X2 [Venturia canescens]
MLRLTTHKMCLLLLACLSLTAAKPPPPTSPWAGFGKSAGPPFGSPGMGVIGVPYMPKASPFFPKFVDPAAMISKKTAMLGNLFGGLGPVDYTGQQAGDFLPYASRFGASTPVLYSPEMGDYSSGAQGFTSGGKDKMKRDDVGSVQSNVVDAVPKLVKMSRFVPAFAGPGSSAYSSANFPTKFDSGFSDAGSVRSRRSIVGADDAGPGAGKPDAVSTPKEMIPGMFGPFGPFKPYGAVTDLPIPKTTIVPADFWLPSSIIPGPTEYTDKVSTFLQKLFDNLKLNKTLAPVESGVDNGFLTRSLADEPSVEKPLESRSVDDAKSLSAAKQIISDSIVAELGELKTDMISALNDYIVYQKTAAIAPGAKKPLKPISPFAAFFAKPTVDPALPFKQRITVLSQVFDMLTQLQKNMSLAVQDAGKDSGETPSSQGPQFAQTTLPKTNYISPDTSKPFDDASAPLNNNFSDPSKPGRLVGMDKPFVTGYNSPISPADFQAALNARILSDYLTPLWSSRPDVPTAKRNVNNEDGEIADSYENERQENRAQYKRLVQMDMHQGYQSMPPGTIESLQAGGGVVPGHQGGGIKLLIKVPARDAREPAYLNDQMKNDEDWSKWAEWAEQFKSNDEGRKHHHNHH